MLPTRCSPAPLRRFFDRVEEGGVRRLGVNAQLPVCAEGDGVDLSFLETLRQPGFRLEDLHAIGGAVLRVLRQSPEVPPVGRLDLSEARVAALVDVGDAAGRVDG